MPVFKEQLLEPYAVNITQAELTRVRLTCCQIEFEELLKIALASLQFFSLYV